MLPSGEWSKGYRLGFYPQIRQIMEREYGRIFANEVSVKDALETIEREGNDLLARFARRPAEPLSSLSGGPRRAGGMASPPETRKLDRRMTDATLPTAGAGRRISAAPRTPRRAVEGAKRVQFSTLWLPALMLAPQLAIIAVFFYWPSLQAIRSSFFIEDPFGFGETFVGAANYTDVLSSSEYLSVAGFTALFTVLSPFCRCRSACCWRSRRTR